RHRVPSPGDATQTPRRSAATAEGLMPTGIGFDAWLSAGSIRTSSPARGGTVVLEPLPDRTAAATAAAATGATATAISTNRPRTDVRSRGPPSTPSASRTSAMSSRHEEYRAFGSFASALPSTSSTASGNAGLRSLAAGTGSFTWPQSTAITESPAYGGFPV